MTQSSPSSRLLVLLGPTAVGKTRLAARLAHAINGAVISADSRQVFRGMDIGTGKDRSDYQVEGKEVEYWLIDILEAGEEYSVFSFMKDFVAAHDRIIANEKVPVLCGGTGLYLDAVLKGYALTEAPEDPVFRDSVRNVPDDNLLGQLEGMRSLHNTTDSLDRERIIRALEIERYTAGSPSLAGRDFSDALVFGLRFERAAIRERITTRLKSRLEQGMVDEVKSLMDRGVPAERLKYYGLEYKFLASYLMGELTYDQMFRGLNTAIHQFAKRQMTWFRRMERNGVVIHWLEGEDGEEYNLELMLKKVKRVGV